MKTITTFKIGLFCALILAAVSGNSQNTFPTPTGNVGIGTLNLNNANNKVVVAGGGVQINSQANSSSKTDAAFQIIGSSGCCDRLTQLSPDVADRQALNIIADLDPNNNLRWYSWGVKNGVYQINPGTIFNGQGFSVDGAGRAGIGTSFPAHKLHVSGGGIYASDYISTPGSVFGNGFRLPWNYYDGLYYEANELNVSYMKLKANRVPIDIAACDSAAFIRFSTGGNQERMRVTDAGNVNINNRLYVGDRIYAANKVVIGAVTDDSKVNNYALAVNGTAIANRIMLKQYPSWPDYVFEPSYDLTSLSSLETFIKQYKHLPEVASATEVGKDGLDVGATQAVLLKKIEELTLYVIEQSKENKELKKRVEQLERNKK